MATENQLSEGSNIESPLSNPGYNLDVDKARIENLKLMDEMTKKLSDRQGGVPWFKIAAGFLKPTRTGSFGESAGNAAESLADWQEKQEAQDIPIAKMKLELNQAKLGALNEIKASTLMAQALGTDVPTASQKISSGNVNQNEMGRLMSFYPEISRADPKQGEVLKNLFEMNVKQGTLTQSANANKVSAIDKIVSYPELLPAFIAEGILPEGFTLEDAQNVKQNEKATQPQGAQQTTANLTTSNVQALNPPKTTSDGKPMTPEMQVAYVNASQKVPPLPGESIHDKHARIEAQMRSDLKMKESKYESSLRMGEEQAKSQLGLEAEDQKARQKAYHDKHDTLAQYDYGTMQLANAKAQELTNIVAKNKDVVGLMMQGGIFNQLGTLMQKGVNTPWGSFNVDIDNMIRAGLPPEKQAVARNIAQIIAELNQNVMKTGKSIYGPQISTFDAEQMAKPGFAMTDPASFITYLAGKHRIVNTYNGEVASAMQQYFEDHPKANTSSFFNINNKNSPYKSIIDRFNTTYQDYQSKSPFAQQGQ